MVVVCCEEDTIEVHLLRCMYACLLHSLRTVKSSVPSTHLADGTPKHQPVMFRIWEAGGPNGGKPRTTGRDFAIIPSI